MEPVIRSAPNALTERFMVAPSEDQTDTHLLLRSLGRFDSIFRVRSLVAEGFFGEAVDEQSDGSDPISLNVDLSDDEGFSRQGTLQVRFVLDKYGCEFGKSTIAKTSSTSQLVFDNDHHDLEEMTVELVRKKAEQFVLDLIAGKLFH
jgi:hypothetical protein